MEFIENNEDSLEDFFQNAIIGFHLFGADQIIIDMNEYELSLIGYSRYEVIGKKKWSDFVIPAHKKRFESHWNHLLRRKNVQNMEYTLIHKDGHKVDVLLNASGRFDHQGTLINTRGIVVDISQRKNLEKMIQLKNKELDSANEKLREASLLKSEFVSRASHELRTPLISIIGFAQTLLMDESELLPDERRKFLGIIEEEGKRLNTLITDMLDLSKIEIGITTMRYESFDFLSMIQESVEIFQESSGFPVRIESQENFSPVYADKSRLMQVMLNLLNNAFLYGKDGEKVLITVKLMDDKVEVGIHDYGPGISSGDLPHIFEKFYRGEAGGKSKGSGLGLAISNEIITEHGGKLRVESTPSKGASFYFTIPFNVEIGENFQNA